MTNSRILKTWIGKNIQYNSKEKVVVLDEDDTHILIQFDSGAKIVTSKNLYNRSGDI